MGKPFKMKGHTLPGINQRSEGDTDLPDGRSASAALQYKSPAKQKIGAAKPPKKTKTEKPPKKRINVETGKHEMHTGTKTNPVTGKKTETYSAY